MTFESRKCFVGVTGPIIGEEARDEEGRGLLLTRFCVGEATGVEEVEVAVLVLFLPVPTQAFSKLTRNLA